MAHTEKRASPWREFQLGLIGGAIYGTAHTFSGHGLDNLKARLQLDKSYLKLSTISGAQKLWAERGLYGLFQGILPPLFGSVAYRMTMLSAYEAAYTHLNEKPKESFWQLEIAHGYIPRPLVFASALFSSVTRSFVESPFEYMKVMRQTDGNWKFRDMYRGFGIQTLRTTSMLMWIFVPYDVVKQKTTWMTTYSGQFIATTVICCWCYAVSWPFETLKNMAQGGVPFVNASYQQRVQFLGGFRGLYRGAAIGIIGGGFRNGVAMVTMNNWQRLASSWGLRKE